MAILATQRPHPSPRPFVVALLALAGACSTFDPTAGAPQGAGDAGCGLGASGYGTAYGSPTGSAATAAFCTADGGTFGGACDACEAASCCALRVACYSDATCSCADQTLDTCTTALPDAAEDAAAAAAGSCWTAFAAASSIAEERYECLRGACASACGIPQ